MRKKLLLFTGLSLILLGFYRCKPPDKQQQKPKKNEFVLNNYKKALQYKKVYEYDSAFILLYQALDSIDVHQKDTLTALIYTQIGIINYYNYNLPESEYNIVQALKVLPENNHKYKSYIYSILGLIAQGKKDYNTALKYGNTAYTIAKKSKDTLKPFIKYQNNLGNLFAQQKAYKKALQCYDIILDIDSIAQKYPSKYARALGNKAHVLLQLSDTKNVLPLLQTSLRYRAKTNNVKGVATVNFEMAKYYLAQKNLAKSKAFALKSLQLAQRSHIPYQVLELYHLLGNVDANNATDYLNKYKKLQDSLLTKERLFKEHATALRYKSEENEKRILVQQHELDIRNKRIYFLGVLSFIVLLSAFFLGLQKRKIKNQYLQLGEKNARIDKQNEELQKQHAVISGLQREIHHRLKNNFGIVDSFIDEVTKKKDDDVIFQLNLLKKRIGSIANIHLKIYKSKDVTRVNIKQLIDELYANVKQLFGNQNVTFKHQTPPDIDIDTERSFVISLLVFEFINNSFKYAFKGISKPEIYVKIELVDNQYVMNLKDNGTGLPKSIDIKNIKTYGLKMIRNWAIQLGGKLVLIDAKGLHFRIVFPLNNLKVNK